MASEMIRPSVVSFLDTMLRSRDAVMRVEELRITTTSSFCGQSLGRSGLLNVENVSIVAIGSEHGEFRFNPSPHHILSAGDIIIAMGEAARLRNLYDT
jgi:voltage-gated potassium channel